MRPAPPAVVVVLAVALAAGCAPARAGEDPSVQGSTGVLPGVRTASDAPVSWRQFGADGYYLFSRPAHLDRSGWTKFGILFGTGAALYLVRDDVRTAVQGHREGWSDEGLDHARLMGRGGAPLLTAAGFTLAGLVRHSAYDRETGSLVLENLVYASAITATAQRVFATERPRNGDGTSWFTATSSGHSVSGDVTVAASVLAPVIDRHLLVDDDDGTGVRFWKRFGAFSLYGLAGMVAVQRVNVDAHWLPDVYFGYVNALAVGRTLVDARRGGRGWRDDRRARRVQVEASAAGLRITWP